MVGKNHCTFFGTFVRKISRITSGLSLVHVDHSVVRDHLITSTWFRVQFFYDLTHGIGKHTQENHLGVIDTSRIRHSVRPRQLICFFVFSLFRVHYFHTKNATLTYYSTYPTANKYRISNIVLASIFVEYYGPGMALREDSH